MNQLPGLTPQTLSDRDLREAIKLGYLNFDNVKPEFQPELKTRIEALEAERNRRKAARKTAAQAVARDIVTRL